jgi:hypothetical protein
MFCLRDHKDSSMF